MLKRKTKLSIKVLEILKSSDHPISVPLLLEKLSEIDLHPNKTSVYRIIDKLIEKKLIIQIVSKSGCSYYEFATCNSHYHFICNECQKARRIDMSPFKSLNLDIKDLESKNEFKIQSLNFNIYGVCFSCLSNEGQS